MGESVDDDNPDPVGARQGDIVMRKYRLESPLGVGAGGSVWAAVHTSLGHKVAVKFLHGTVAASRDARMRFEREAKLAARLSEASHHIARVMDHGVMDGGIPCLVMEQLLGETLDERLQREGTLPLPLVSRIVTHLCKALTVAHAAGVVHRDIKPANVFLCTAEDGSGELVKLLDFGVAKARLENEDAQTTKAGAIFGTPSYISPEQFQSDGGIDARSDVWSVSAIAYRAIVGRPPFGVGSMAELAMRIVAIEPTAPSSCVRVAPAFDDWIRRGLAKDPANRFQTAREAADALANIAQLPPSDAEAPAPPPTPMRGSSWPRLALAALALALVVALVLAKGRRPSPTSMPTPVTSAPQPGPLAASASPPSSALRAQASPSTAPCALPPPPAALPSAAPAPDKKGVGPAALAASAAAPPIAASSPAAPAPVSPDDPGKLWDKKDEM